MPGLLYNVSLSLNGGSAWRTFTSAVSTRVVGSQVLLRGVPPTPRTLNILDTTRSRRPRIGILSNKHTPHSLSGTAGALATVPWCQVRQVHQGSGVKTLSPPVSILTSLLHDSLGSLAEAHIVLMSLSPTATTVLSSAAPGKTSATSSSVLTVQSRATRNICPTRFLTQRRVDPLELIPESRRSSLYHPL